MSKPSQRLSYTNSIMMCRTFLISLLFFLIFSFLYYLAVFRQKSIYIANNVFSCYLSNVQESALLYWSGVYFFQAWGSLMSLKSQTRDPQLKVPPGGLVLRIFTSWKNPSTSVVFEPANLGSRGEYVTPRPSTPTTCIVSFIWKSFFFLLLLLYLYEHNRLAVQIFQWSKLSLIKSIENNFCKSQLCTPSGS